MFENTTLCYPERDGKFLMLHRIKRQNDINRDKWIGIGGHFEEGESPEDCVTREYREETGGTPENLRFRGIITFVYKDVTEFMHLFSCSVPDDFEVKPDYNDEGVLEFISREKVWNLDLWEGDRIFLYLLEKEVPFFSLKLVYSDGGILLKAVLNGEEMELFDELDSSGNKTGARIERSVAHRLGRPHGTVHMWLWRRGKGPSGIDVLVQKRAAFKDSNPGCYDISSAGHIGAGDDASAAAPRELFEELGIKCKSSELKFVGRNYGEFEGKFYGFPFIDREFSSVYTLEVKGEPAFVLQESEVESVKWIDIDEVISAVENGIGDFPNCIRVNELKMVRESL